MQQDKDFKTGAVTHHENSLSIANRVYVPDSAEEKALVRKIDRRLVPVIWGIYVLSYLDRANIGNAKSGGMEKDLNLTSDQYSVILLVFFIGYVLAEVPSNMLLSRFRPSVYLPSIMFVWGGISIAMAGCNSWKTLSIVRALLGIAEAGFSPGALFLLSSWYKRNELARRYCIYYSASAISGALGGLLAGAITGNVNAGGLAGWRWLFIIEGTATCVAAIGAYWLLPDYPLTTKWLTEDEKWLAAARLNYDSVGGSGGADKEEGHWKSLKSALSDWRCWMMTFLFVLVTGSQTIQYFIPTLMGQLGYKGTMVQYMSIPVYMVATVAIIVFPFSSDLWKERPIHLSMAAAMSAISFGIIIGVDSLKVKYAFLCFAVAGIYACAPLTLVWTSNIISWPAEKRAITQAFVNAIGNSASIYGAFLWPKNTAPKYTQGFATTLAMVAALCVGAQVMRFLNLKYPYMVKEDSNRDAELETPTYDKEQDI